MGEVAWPRHFSTESDTNPSVGELMGADRLPRERAVRHSLSDDGVNWSIGTNTITCSQQTVATASFSPLFLPMDVRVVMNEGTLQVFLNGKMSIAYDDPNPIPAGGIGLGDNGAFVSFDDVVIKDRLNLCCSADTMLNGEDPVCAAVCSKKLRGFICGRLTPSSRWIST
jgi:hypothetical protein